MRCEAINAHYLIRIFHTTGCSLVGKALGWGSRDRRFESSHPDQLMKTLPRDESDRYFQEFWDKCHQECIKIEVLQDYSGEDSGRSLKAWLAGDKKASLNYRLQDKPKEWIRMCQEKLASGVTLKRFRVTEKPQTLYLSWEIEHYKHINIPLCGEEVYLAVASELARIDIPLVDMMIFDRKRVVENKYDATGFMTHQTFYDKNDDIRNFLEIIPKLAEVAKKVGK